MKIIVSGARFKITLVKNYIKPKLIFTPPVFSLKAKFLIFAQWKSCYNR